MAVTVLRWLPVALLALLGSAPAILRAEDAAKPEGCQTPSEMPGQCIALKACEPLARLTLPNHSPNAADKQLLRDSVCGEIYQEKVCCPTTKEGTIPATAASATDSPAGEDASDSDEGSGVGERIGGDDGEPDAVGERRFRLPGRGRRPNLIVGSNQPGRQWGQPVGTAFDLLNNLFTSTSPSMPSLGGGFNDNPFHNNPYNNPFMNSNPFNSPFNNPYENNPYNPFNSDYTTTRRPFGGSSFGNDFTTTRRPFGGSSFGEDFTTRRPFAGGSFGNDFTTRRPFGGSSFGNDFTTTRRPFGGSSFGNDFTTTRRPFGGSSLGTDFSGSRPSNPRPNRPMKNSGGPLINPPECGPLNSDDKIVGGNMTAIMELPWMARLGYESRGGRGVSYRCGGSLINSRYVLTAAHCTGGKDNPVQVRLGEHDAESQEDCSYMAGEKICAPPVVDVDVEQVIRHPEYSDDASSSDYLQNDIALLRLRTPVKFTQAVKPICLPETSTRQNLEGKKAVVSGWGKDRNRGSSGTRFLMKASVPLINNRECARIFRERRISINENSQVCAGGKRGVDSCQGDSGGPLYRPDAMNDGLRVVQMGVVSFGLQNCATEGVPGVYTRVQHFMPWIRSNMRP